ncbi:hypothetical protein DM02DRAFT_4085 [Periconia macrospinosa]|uniref:Uncharacterized protein n=1 Tax=Periconia macrospinosa TaxID=97972 RepID=A0A2V1ED81_9PLEO|nr:hypothetical protein DM02DRAFT_4085 [Periconia macrospinosa]
MKAPQFTSWLSDTPTLVSMATSFPTTSSFSYVPTPPTIAVPSLHNSDIENSNNIIFGVLDVLLTTLGLISTVITLRFMYQSRSMVRHSTRENGGRDIEMAIRSVSPHPERESSDSTLRGDVALEESTLEGDRPTTE